VLQVVDVQKYNPIIIINPATKYFVFRASSLTLIKAWLAPRRKCPWGAGNGPVLVKSRNAEQGPPNNMIF